MKNSEEDAYSCPSFNYYSSDRLAEIAIQLADEKNQINEDEEFEFAFVRQNEAEKSFFDGKLGQILPVIDKDHSINDLITNRENNRSESRIAIQLSNLSIENRDYPPSCSSSDSDEIENIPAGRYCVWRWKKAETTSPSQCKKSKSTGSTSRRCKLRGFLRRSNSEGKGSFVFLPPKHREEKKSEKSTEAPIKLVKGNVPPSPSAHEALYLRNRAAKESYKKKSYLPYRQDLLGFFANVNGSSKTFPHL